MIISLGSLDKQIIEERIAFRFLLNQTTLDTRRATFFLTPKQIKEIVIYEEIFCYSNPKIDEYIMGKLSSQIERVVVCFSVTLPSNRMFDPPHSEISFPLKKYRKKCLTIHIMIICCSHIQSTLIKDSLGTVMHFSAEISGMHEYYTSTPPVKTNTDAKL